MLLVGIAGWANTNNLSLALEAQGPRIDPLQLMREVKDLPIEEWGYPRHIEAKLDWLKANNPNAPAVTRLAEEEGDGRPQGREI
jgi:hypothetical protein